MESYNLRGLFVTLKILKTLLFKNRVIGIIICLIIQFLVIASVSLAQDASVNLFEIDSNFQKNASESLLIGSEKTTPVILNDNLIQELKSSSIDKLSIADDRGNTFPVIVKKRIDHGLYGWSIVGYIGDDHVNSFVFSKSDNKVLISGEIRDEDYFFQVRYDSNMNKHFFSSFAPSDREILMCEVDDLIDQERSDSFKQDLEESSGSSTIDVMVVYTRNAESWANSRSSGIKNVINQAMAIAQNSVDNSNININFRLVHSERVNYGESGNSETDLRRLTSGYIDNVQNWRNSYGADLVSMFTLANDAGGVAWMLNTTSGLPQYAYSISRVQQAGWTTTHAHEMGHNMGNAHSRNQYRGAAPSSGGLFTYSTGWRWYGDSGREYSSVMTYNEGALSTQHYSNPNVRVDGESTGSYSGFYAPADNARSMREIMHVIEDYRRTRVYNEPPEVSTRSVTNIEPFSATSGGNVTDNGTAKVTERGICWDTNRNPNFSNSCSSSGNGLGSFTNQLINLQPNTRYYVRAYATNSVGTSFGNERNFITERLNLPEVSTLAAENIGPFSATVGGNVIDSGTTEVTERGICWDTNGNPNFSDSCVSSGNGLGTFTIRLTNLQPNTNHFVRAYATNSVGSSFGNERKFKTPLIPPDPNLSEITVVDNKVIANGSDEAEILVKIVDDKSNVLGGYRVELTSENNVIRIDDNTKRTNKDGEIVFWITSDVPAVATFGAIAEGVELSQTVEVMFIPVAPIALNATSVKERELVANWEMVAGASSYELDVSSDSNFQSKLTSFDNKNVGNVTNSLVTGVSPGSDYWYRIRAVANNILGAYSDTIKVSTFPDVPLARSSSNIGATYFTANWEDADGADEYVIDVSIDENFDEYVEGLQSRNVGKTTSFEVDNLRTGTTYFYRVRSVAEPRISANSDIQSAKTLEINTDNSTMNSDQLRVLANGEQPNTINVHLKGNDSQPLDRVTVNISVVDGSATINQPTKETDENGSATFEVTSRTPNVVTYTVEAEGKNIGQIKTEFLENTGTLVLGNNFPNPFSKTTIIPVSVPKPMNINISVFNSIGKPVKTIINETKDVGYYEILFTTDGLASGVYFYRLSANAQSKVRKMIFVN